MASCIQVEDESEVTSSVSEMVTEESMSQCESEVTHSESERDMEESEVSVKVVAEVSRSETDWDAEDTGRSSNTMASKDELEWGRWLMMDESKLKEYLSREFYVEVQQAPDFLKDFAVRSKAVAAEQLAEGKSVYVPAVLEHEMLSEYLERYWQSCKMQAPNAVAAGCDIFHDRVCRSPLTATLPPLQWDGELGVPQGVLWDLAVDGVRAGTARTVGGLTVGGLTAGGAVWDRSGRHRIRSSGGTTPTRRPSERSATTARACRVPRTSPRRTPLRRWSVRLPTRTSTGT